MKASERCISLIQEFEGYAAQKYDDVGGKPTIGYGHLIRAGEAFPARLSESDATALLCRDLEGVEACVEGAVDTTLSQDQFDALASFVFNLGCSKFAGSTLLRKLNAGDYAGAAAEFPKWCRVGAKEVPGLLRRRLAEQLLFNSSVD